LKKILFSCLLFYFISFSIQAQEEETDCSDLKTGVFIIPADDMVPFSTKIVRNTEYQTEYASDGTEKSARLKWLSDCSYLMLADPETEGEDPSEKVIREYGGILVDIVSRKGDTIHFTARLLRGPKESEVRTYMVKIE
jgi:hypothetical protein